MPPFQTGSRKRKKKRMLSLLKLSRLEVFDEQSRRCYPTCLLKWDAPQGFRYFSADKLVCANLALHVLTHDEHGRSRG